MLFPVKRLADLGFEIVATEGTADVLRRNGVDATVVGKHSHGLGDDVEGLADDQLSHLRVLHHLGEEAANGEHLAESLEDLDEPAMLVLRKVGIDDVVVEEIGAGARCYGEQLVSRGVDEDGAQGTDFGGDVDRHRGKITAG